MEPIETSREVKRGDIWYVRSSNLLDSGSVQKGTRPCIIVSNNLGNKTSTICSVIPLTTKAKKNLPINYCFTIGTTFNVALCNQLFACTQSNLVGKIGALPEYIMNEIDHRIKWHLALEPIPGSDKIGINKE